MNSSWDLHRANLISLRRHVELESEAAPDEIWSDKVDLYPSSADTANDKDPPANSSSQIWSDKADDPYPSLADAANDKDPPASSSSQNVLKDCIRPRDSRGGRPANNLMEALYGVFDIRDSPSMLFGFKVGK